MSIEPAVDYGDVQGLVRFGYRRMTVARYDLLRVRSPAAARSWLRSAPVTSAREMAPPPTSALHVAFTAPGLAALGVPATVIDDFSHEFRGGMTEESRARLLGDTGANAPATWEWGHGANEPHVLVMWFAEPGQFDPLLTRTLGPDFDSAFELVRRLETSNLDGIEPFGFADGSSQPQVDWLQERRTPREDLEYGNVVALGEFLLGYRNEYGRYTDRPLLRNDPTTEKLPSAPDAPGRRDLGRNGTYLVLRQLEQDVRDFWQFVDRCSQGDPGRAETIAAAMVGRTRAGDPLVPASGPIAGVTGTPEQVRRNQFTFTSDPEGRRCPFGAHVRRANPRSADIPGRPRGLARLASLLGFRAPGFRDDLVSSARFHRLLRRGREYGPELDPADARMPATPGEPPRGLHFICLNANLCRQFEFVQNAWLASATFDGLGGEDDPIVGPRTDARGNPRRCDFSMPNERGLPDRIAALPGFVRVRGGAYFFLPGLRALEYIAGAAGA